MYIYTTIIEVFRYSSDVEFGPEVIAHYRDHTLIRLRKHCCITIRHEIVKSLNRKLNYKFGTYIAFTF